MTSSAFLSAAKPGKRGQPPRQGRPAIGCCYGPLQILIENCYQTAGILPTSQQRSIINGIILIFFCHNSVLHYAPLFSRPPCCHCMVQAPHRCETSMTRLLPLFTLPLLLAACATTAPSTMPAPSITISSRLPRGGADPRAGPGPGGGCRHSAGGRAAHPPGGAPATGQNAGGPGRRRSPSGALHGAVQPRRSAGAGCLPGRSHRRGGAHS